MDTLAHGMNLKKIANFNYNDCCCEPKIATDLVIVFKDYSYLYRIFDPDNYGEDWEYRKAIKIPKKQKKLKFLCGKRHKCKTLNDLNES